MTFLVDWQIRELCKQALMIYPFNDDQVNPVSYDVRIGFNIILEGEFGWREISIADKTKLDPYWLYPGECVLTETWEKFNLPYNICADFVLKSSRGREFYEHMKAGWCDPGWRNSVLTMELKNNCQFHRLPLYPGLLIGQMIFSRLSEFPKKSYSETGRYNNDTKVKRSKG